MLTTAEPKTSPSSPVSCGPGEAFSKGDFTDIALHGDRQEWATLAARCLIGTPHSAAAALEDFDSDEAAFYAGVGHWIDGNDAKATALLERADTQHARNLLALIRKDRIHVLTQMPWTRDAGPCDLLAAASPDEKFKVSNIGHSPRDLKNEPYLRLEKYVDPRNPPDLYVCSMAEWHHVPINIQELSCPIIAHTLDYDACIQTVHPWLPVFDELIVPDHHQSETARRFTSSPVSTYPKFFAVHDTLSAIPPGRRPLDVIVDVPMAHPWHSDRAGIVHELLSIPDIALRFADRSAPDRTHHELLRHGRICVVHHRHTRGMVPAAVEALSMGCAAVVEEGCVLPAYLKREHGVFTYGPEGGSLTAVVRDVLANWAQLEEGIRTGTEIVRKQFARSRVMSQYLRFLTFLASRPRTQRQRLPGNNLHQKRVTLARGEQMRDVRNPFEWREANVQRWNERLASGLDRFAIIDIARELVLEYATEHARPQLKEQYRTLFEGVIRLYETGVKHFPKSLVMRFNLIRTALHFGNDTETKRAIELLDKTLREPKSTWRVDPRADVFPYDFQSECFNYRRYFDLLVDMHANQSRLHRDLIGLIQASLNHYKGVYCASPDHLKRAVELDPDFPHYRLAYAKRLVADQSDTSRDEAGEILLDLAQHSSLFVQAFEVLEQMHSQGLYAGPEFETLGRKVLRAQQSGIVMQDRWEGIV